MSYRRSFERSLEEKKEREREKESPSPSNEKNDSLETLTLLKLELCIYSYLCCYNFYLTQFTKVYVYMCVCVCLKLKLLLFFLLRDLLIDFLGFFFFVIENSGIYGFSFNCEMLRMFPLVENLTTVPIFLFAVLNLSRTV